MSEFTNLVPVVSGLVLTWFVALGIRELYKEASLLVIRKRNALS